MQGNISELRKLIRTIIRLGVGSCMLIAGTALIFCGVVMKWDWPQYLISGGIILLSGLLAVSLEIFKDLRQLRIELQKERTNTEKHKNFETYKNETRLKHLKGDQKEWKSNLQKEKD